MIFQENKFQKNINGLRAIAVISVVLFHFQLFNVTSGFVGVDIFFVISGYLMTKILITENNTNLLTELKNFYANRIRRIVPALAVVTLCALLLFSTKLLYVDFNKLLKSNTATNLFFSNYFYYLVQGGYFESAAENNPLLHTWSLSLEWQFYIAYPIVILLAKKIFNKPILSLFLIILLIFSLTFSVFSTYSDLSYAYYSLESRAWEFISGGLVAVIHLINANKKDKQTPISLQIFIFIGLMISMFFIEQSKFPGWQAIAPVLLTAMVIYDRGESFLNKILSIKPIQFIGNISYSLYLWHWVVFSYTSIVVVVDRALSIDEKILGVIISLLLAFLTFEVIEKRTRSKNGFWTNRRIVLLWVVSVVISITSLIVVAKTQNSNFRLPEYMRRVEIGMEDKNPNLKACMSSHEEAIARGYVPKFCRFGAPNDANARVLLWGDSHADALQPAIDFALKKVNFGGIASTASGCAPFDGVGYVTDELKASFSHCSLGHGKNTIEFIHKTDSIKYVMMHANWARYDFNILRSELVPQVCEIKKSGKKIIIIGQVPIPNFDVPRVWANRQLKIGHELDEITFDESISNKVNDSFKELVQDIENSCGKVQVIYPSEGLCESGKCYAVKNGKLNYIDTGHLSANGATNIQEIILKNLPMN